MDPMPPSRGTTKANPMSIKMNPTAITAPIAVRLIRPFGSPTGHPCDCAAEAEGQQHLHRHVLGKPGKLSQLTRRVGEARSPTWRKVGTVLGERTGPADIPESRSQQQFATDGQRDADRRERIVDQQRPA